MKHSLTRREVAELSYYISQNPIDDQSNFHYPMAALYALTFNLNRNPGKQAAISLHEALLFRKAENDDVDMLDSQAW